jgi:hypothetical protein
VINPSPEVPVAGKLVVLLPGTGAEPADYARFLAEGSARGYHVIGLSYANSQSVEGLCQNSPATDCHAEVREEILTGQDRSSLLQVSPPNAINNRINRLLTWLHTQFPDEGWDQFVGETSVSWPRITVAGHSQGGGHAAFIAKRVRVDRAVYFGAPPDWNLQRDAPALWLGAPGATDASRQFGVVHLRDNIVPPARADANWRQLGMAAGGPVVLTDSTSAPWGNSHRLTTDLPFNPASRAQNPFHGAPITDASTPLDAQGEPRYRTLWHYLAFP